MAIVFSEIRLNHTYGRPELAKLWGYQSFNAISRGVVSPRDQPILVFFVTREKQEALTQYEDHIDADFLFWEGEMGHGNDQRIVRRQDEIHVFYRDRHHSDFMYKGRAVLVNYRLYPDRPSKFTFQLADQWVDDEELLSEPQLRYGVTNTVREALVQSRVGQGEYRRKALDLWGSCSVTGFSKQPILIASHIKPWRLSNNQERLDPSNSLMLVPTLDKLFDRGYIGFETNGRILLSGSVRDEDWKRIHVTPDLSLRRVPLGSEKFLEFHREYLFDVVEG